FYNQADDGIRNRNVTGVQTYALPISIFMKIRQTNIRSYKAALKIPYVELGNHTYQHIYKKMNQPVAIYDLFAITKSAYFSYKSADRTNLINTDENAI